MFDTEQENTRAGSPPASQAMEVPTRERRTKTAEALPPYLQTVGEAGNALASPEPSSTTDPAAGGRTVAPGSGSTDACPNPEEERRKERFRRRTFAAPDFRPSSGVGKFDAYYWPWMSLMAAVVKMHFRFVQSDDTPSPLQLLLMLVRGQDITPFFWTEAQKRQYERDFEQRVSRQWSFVHRFRSIRPCWPFLADPLVFPLIVADAGRAHFNVVVHKMSSPTGFRGSSMRPWNTGAPGWQGTGDLDENDVRLIRDRFSRDVARNERQRIEQAIAASHASPVYFARDSATVRPTWQAALRRLAVALRGVNPSTPAIPLHILGFASADGSREHNLRLSRRRAEAVATILGSEGVPQPLLAIARGPVGASGDAANRRATLEPDRSFEGGYTGNRFLPAGHEFGHALGLPDEYTRYAQASMSQWQDDYADLARRAGVAPPDAYGTRTSSVMSVGEDVLPRHYLTLWEALGHMTQPDIRRDQWRID